MLEEYLCSALTVTEEVARINVIAVSKERIRLDSEINVPSKPIDFTWIDSRQLAVLTRTELILMSK